MAKRLRVLILLVFLGAMAAMTLHTPNAYLLFHSVAELFSVVIAVGIFLVAWNTRELAKNGFFCFLGISFLFVGVLDTIHLLTYKGMQILPGLGVDPPTQVWLVARYLVGLSLVLAPLYLKRRLAPYLVLTAFVAVVGLLLLAIFYWRVFPSAFVEGEGLTTFKQASEVAICLLLVGAGVHLWYRRRLFDPRIYRLLLGFIGLSVISEITFMLYNDPYAFFNRLGHVLKVAAYYVFYKATIDAALRSPFKVIFRELTQREEALERANAELASYAHTVSHDLKGPLAAVSGAGSVIVSLLQADQLEGETAGKLRQMGALVERNARRAANLVDELLELAEAGQRPQEVVPVDLQAVVQEVIEERQAELEGRGGEIRVVGQLGVLRGAQSQLYQVFANLIANAIRHSDRQHPLIVVQRLEGPAGVNRYLVRDNGHGIPEDQLERIFDPFCKGRRGGSGLGLSTVKKIVTVYGGEIRAYNDDGACFEFSLADIHDTALS